MDESQLGWEVREEEMGADSDLEDVRFGEDLGG